MGQITLVRHGQASFGSADYDRLSALGVEQSRRLGLWLAERGQPFDTIVTGGMLRHRQTAEACLAAMPAALSGGDAWIVDPDFNEYDHHEVLVRHWPAFDDPEAVKAFLCTPAGGHPDGRRAFQKIFEDAMARWMSGAHDADYAETWERFRTRCIAALVRLAANAGPSQNLLVFTSGGPIAAIAQHLFEMPDHAMASLNWTLVNCGLTKLFYRGQRMSLGYLNSHAHFEADPDFITYR